MISELKLKRKLEIERKLKQKEEKEANGKGRERAVEPSTPESRQNKLQIIRKSNIVSEKCELGRNGAMGREGSGWAIPDKARKNRP